MTRLKLFKISLVLLFAFTIVVGLTSINHPIVLKWLTGSARLVGRPIKASVYTNEKMNDDIKLFHVDKYWNGQNADYYIVFASYLKDNSKLKFFSLNRMDNYLGRPSATNIRDYDFIAGFLFQSEVGGHFTPFQEDIKGYNFDPKLKFYNRQIKLNLPPSAKELKCDSIRVDL